MARSSEVVPVGATPAGVFDIACRVAESGGSLPTEITEAARAVAGELGSFPPDEVRGALAELDAGLVLRVGVATGVVIAGADGLSDGSTVRVVRDMNPYTGEKNTVAASPTSTQTNTSRRSGKPD